MVLGVGGLIGHSVFRALAVRADWSVIGVSRSSFVHTSDNAVLLDKIDVMTHGILEDLFAKHQPSVVVNCIGITKHVHTPHIHEDSIGLNALLPHRLERLCAQWCGRLIQISSDCVFSGATGNYLDDDVSDAVDLYGKTKALGELESDNALTLRTSTIGHELSSTRGLLEWFRKQTDSCSGFKRAIFSGLTTYEFARVIRDVVIPLPSLKGILNVGGAPIDKYSLLKLIANVYGVNVRIDKDERFKIDRSLNSNKFSSITGYCAPDWETMVTDMLRDYIEHENIYV